MTKVLYLLDCYLKEFDAVIETVDDSGLSVVFNQTAFYPTSGGQPTDTGTITSGGVKYLVVDVIKKDGVIIHQVDTPGLSIGDKVHCTIDWDRRYKLMRYHTASHILSTLINQETGAEITGNQLYLDKARVDFSLENFDRALMQGFQDKTNEIIRKNLPVSFRILAREEAFKIPSLVKLRKHLPETIIEIRIVDIASPEFDFDHQACGGTHLKNTSEIGEIEIYELENKGKERRRIYFRIKE
jgi:misacylated tRNA(Ala) deacylase